MVKQIPSATFPAKNTEPQSTVEFVDPQRRITPEWRRWTEFVDVTIRRFASLFTFLALEDTPDSYSGQSHKGVRVNAGETALEFFALPTAVGDFIGPGSSVTNDFVQFADTTGKLGKDGGLSLDTDGTLAANSDSKIPSQKAVKTYVNAGDATTLSSAQTYTDGKVAGLSWKQAVRAATTANGTLATAFANGQVIDGVTLATGDRILLKNQTTGTENGLYIVAASGAPARSTDANTGANILQATCYVEEGTTNADTQWTCTTNAPITIGATSLAFAQLSTGGGITQLTGDVTAGPGSGSQAATIANDAVTYAKIQNASANTFIARAANSSGDLSEVALSASQLAGRGASGDITAITLGANLSMSGTTLNAIAGGSGGLQHEYECFGSLATAASFTGVNTSVTSLADGAVSLFESHSSTGPNTLEIWKKAAPSTPYNLYCRYMARVTGANDQFGICVRNSSNGKVVAYGSNFGSPLALTIQNWTNATTFSSSVASASFQFWMPTWSRIENDGTNLKFYHSMDGNEWSPAIATVTLASFIGTADEIGIYIVPQHAFQAWVGNFGTTTPT